MKTKRVARITFACGAVAFLAIGTACGDVADSETVETESVETATDELVTRTIVVLHDDGTETVKTVQVTAEQTKRDLEARKALQAKIANGEVGVVQQAIAQDTSCVSSSMWMFDGLSYTGNQICFSGTGAAYLANYCTRWSCGGWPAQCCGWWNDRVESYDAGQAGGAFINGSYDCSSTCTGFSAYAQVSNASSCEEASDWLVLGTCPPG